jgi:hypothetical protein
MDGGAKVAIPADVRYLCERAKRGEKSRKAGAAIPQSSLRSDCSLLSTSRNTSAFILRCRELLAV